MKRVKILILAALIILALLSVVGWGPMPQGVPAPDKLVIGTIALAPIIVALVEVAKKAGMPTQYAPWLNGGLAFVGYGLMVLILKMPEAAEPVTYGLNFLIVFLMNAGLYDRAQATFRR